MENFVFALDNTVNEPLYFQLYKYIKGEIRASRILSGEKLPSKRSVSFSLKISVNTVESAYNQLEAEGYIYSKDRSGFYVSQLDSIENFGETSVIFVKDDEEPTDTNYLYSFDTSNVDTQFFPYATWSRLTKNLMYNNRELLELGHSQGDFELRKTISNFLHQTRGVNCSPSQVIVGAGSEYLLEILVSLLGRKTSFAMENPCYQKTFSILKNAGAEVNLIPLDKSGIDIGKLSESGARVVHITPSHQFPMGVVMPISRRGELLNWANQVGEDRFIIEDDYDSEFRYSGRPIPSLQGLDTKQKVIYLTTFSKSISPSFRLSVLVLPKPLVEKYRKNFGQYSSTVSRFEQHVLEEFISKSHFERHLNKIRKIYKARRDCLESALMALPDSSKIKILGDNSGLHFVLKIDGKNEKDLVRKAKVVGVKVTGLSNYYLANEKSCPKGAVILGYASLDEDQIEKAVELLKQAWFK